MNIYQIFYVFLDSEILHKNEIISRLLPTLKTHNAQRHSEYFYAMEWQVVGDKRDVLNVKCPDYTTSDNIGTQLFHLCIVSSDDNAWEVVKVAWKNKTTEKKERNRKKLKWIQGSE